MDYNEFLQSKISNIKESGFDINENELNSNLFDFQKYIVKKALKKGKFAIFAECGLGKTIMQLEFAYQVAKKTNGKSLILTPLAVSAQTKNEALRFNISLENIEIINYESLHKIETKEFNCIVLDESSILKNFEGKYKNKIINDFKNTPYKLSCTATPSPNDITELANQFEFLDVMQRNELLATYFVHDSGETQTWRLKKHAENDFYEHLNKFSIFLTSPKDLGFDDKGYNLPEINYKEIEVISKDETLFGEQVKGALNLNKELNNTRNNRLQKTAEIVNSSSDNFIIWVKNNIDGEILSKLIPDAYEVKGATPDKRKEELLIGFQNNEFRVLITKPKIAQFGLNYQNCNNQIFTYIDYSFESLYQSVRRSHRFGQKNAVNIYLITTSKLKYVLSQLKNKLQKFQEIRGYKYVPNS